MLNNISLPNIAAPGEVLSTIWQVERMAHATLVRNMTMSLGATEVTISIYYDLMHSLQYSISLRVFNTGWLTINVI
jgi:hypothetical protein